MPSFNILDPQTPLYGPKLLEASAGTGKTFAIEHLFVRLLLEAPPNAEPMNIEQILAITFTRAAAREMRMRIRSNIEQAIVALQGNPEWPYLQSHAGSAVAKRRLEDALLGFDRAQIFTIHGFCQRLLTHYTLESKVSIQSRSEESFRRSAFPRLIDFLEQQTVLSPEQMGRLISKYRTAEALGDALLNAPQSTIGGSFAEDCQVFRQTMAECPFHIDRSTVRKDFEAARKNYKISGFKGVDFDGQIEALLQLFDHPEDVSALRRLLLEQGSLFVFLSPANRKVRAMDGSLSPLLIWCCDHLGPLLQTFSEPKRLFSNLRSAWQQKLESLIEETGLFSPDFLLTRMKRAVADPAFLSCVQQKYRAVIIDEFQDTDAVQWDIFRQIFLGSQQLVYLIGDPKQSIYRFRQADLYTYFQARQTLGENTHYSLDTNYRSTPGLISALNALFSDEHVEPWLWLPRNNRKESYCPVRAGSLQQWDPQDGKQPLHFFTIDDLNESALAYVAWEIAQLKDRVAGYGSFAILVKDRIQAFEAQKHLQSQAIPCWSKSTQPLGSCYAFHAMEEFFEALYFPHDISRLKMFLSGPFVKFSAAQLLDHTLFMPQLIEWKKIVDQQGLPCLFSAFLQETWNGLTVYERIKQHGALFFSDFFQIVEQLLTIRMPSIESIRRLFRQLQIADPEEDPSVRRRADTDAAAVQILTMHASKGLEFDVVFALGAAAVPPRENEEPEEAQAEKLRQLYVTLTRARLRLYIPLVSKKSVREGFESPLELFWRRSKLGSDPQEIVEKLAIQNPHISLECVSCLQPLKDVLSASPELTAPSVFQRKFFSQRMFSYSALSHGEAATLPLPAIVSEEKTLHTMPRGRETGIVLHRILERIIKTGGDIQKIVHEELKLSPLQEWIESIQEMAERVISMPLMEDGSALSDIATASEMEFFFFSPPHYFKGFIDLVWVWKEKLYFADWKTNWLGTDDAAYSAEHLHQAMLDGDYWFQASLYADALKKAWPDIRFGEAFYLFVRGIHSPGRGVLRFIPSPVSLEQRRWNQ